MKNKLIIGIVIGVAATAVLVLAVVGVLSLMGNRAQPQLSGQTQAGTPQAPGQTAQPSTPGNQAEQKQVVFNGRALTARQLQEVETLYRTKAHPGNYWYDSKSGLYGAVGSGAAGFMYPGHDLGPLAADASGGNTGVFINGRNVTMQEGQILSYLAGVQVMPGRYWLDAAGNAGYENNPVPVGNLFAAALTRQQGGGGGGNAGGDNFWNSRFSAGNYNSDNSAGYVSLPNGGTVSYGY